MEGNAEKVISPPPNVSNFTSNPSLVVIFPYAPTLVSKQPPPPPSFQVIIARLELGEIKECQGEG